MEKQTVVTRVRFTVRFSQAALRWLQGRGDAWFAQEHGDLFLAEFGRDWNEILLSEAGSEFDTFFAELGVPIDLRPRLVVQESFRGSWIVEAALIVYASVGTIYMTLKGVSEIPAMADGLKDLKGRISKRLGQKVNLAARERLADAATSAAGSAPAAPAAALPRVVVQTDLTIDARPLLALTPPHLKSHTVHLSLSVSRESLTVENLSDEPIRDLQIGLFREDRPRNQWSFSDAYRAHLGTLSGRQTLAKHLTEFENESGTCFDLSDGNPVHIDCWVGDQTGIYLFHFFLEEE